MARYALVVARFYDELAAHLEAGARGVFEAQNDDVEVFDVPGAFELAAAAQYAARSGRFDGVVCLGAVIRGETDHYDHVCAAAAHGIEKVGLSTTNSSAFGSGTTMLDVPTGWCSTGQRQTGVGAQAGTSALCCLAVLVDGPPGVSAALTRGLAVELACEDKLLVACEFADGGGKLPKRLAGNQLVQTVTFPNVLVERVVEWARSGACVCCGAAAGDGAVVVEDAAAELLAKSTADVVGAGERGVAFGAREQLDDCLAVEVFEVFPGRAGSVGTD